MQEKYEPLRTYAESAATSDLALFRGQGRLSTEKELARARLLEMIAATVGLADDYAALRHLAEEARDSASATPNDANRAWFITSMTNLAEYLDRDRPEWADAGYNLGRFLATVATLQQIRDLAAQLPPADWAEASSFMQPGMSGDPTIPVASETLVVSDNVGGSIVPTLRSDLREGASEPAEFVESLDV